MSGISGGYQWGIQGGLTDGAASRFQQFGTVVREANRNDAGTARGDRVTISSEAQALQDSSLPEDQETYWHTHFGIAAGVTKNGLRREVSFEGNAMEMQEYDGERLVRRVTGERRTTGAVLNTELYDARGTVQQTIHAEVSALDTRSPVVSREIAWYRSGQLAMTLQDSMVLGERDNDISIDEPASVFGEQEAGEVSTLVAESERAFQEHGYKALVRQYTGDVLTKEVSLGWGGLDSKAQDGTLTEALYPQGGPDYAVRDYDTEGSLLRSAEFSGGRLAPGGMVEQTVSVAWYDHSLLSERSGGKLVLEEGKDFEVSRYLSGQPDEAREETAGQSLLVLLTHPESARRHPGLTVMPSPEQSGMTHGKGIASALAEGADGDAEYSLEWQTEQYKDGKLVSRTMDTQKARPNPLYEERDRNSVVEPGGSLSEPAMPKMLKESRHVSEKYSETGQSIAKSEMTFRERMGEDSEGKASVRTQYTMYAQGTYSKISGEAQGRLEDTDRNANGAAVGMRDALGMLLADLNGVATPMREELPIRI